MKIFLSIMFSIIVFYVIWIAIIYYFVTVYPEIAKQYTNNYGDNTLLAHSYVPIVNIGIALFLILIIIRKNDYTLDFIRINVLFWSYHSYVLCL